MTKVREWLPGRSASRCAVPLSFAVLMGIGMAHAGPLAPRLGQTDPLLLPVAIEEATPRAGAFVEDNVRFSALVSRIQDVLKQLGLYNGPVDGAFSPTTERAIRIYESQVALPITGQPTKELLDHLETVGRANKLLVRLGESRERGQREARELLAASELTKKLEVTEPENANPLRDPGPCFAAPTASCLLAEAFESAKTVADVKFRDWVLGDIAVAQAGAGETDLVFRTISLIGDPRLTVAALRDSGIAWARAGKTAEARDVAVGMPDAMAASEVIAAIALAEATSGTPQSLGRTLGELLARASQSGRTAGAASLFATLAAQLKVAGASEAAEDLVNVALDIAQDATLSASDRDRVFGEVAAVLATMGNVEKAKALLQEIGDKTQRRQALLALAERSVAAGDTDGALKAAGDVSDMRYRVIALTDVAIAQVRLGNSDAARETIERARADAEEIDQRFTYAKAFAASRIAAALAELRGFEAAAETASKIDDDGLRAQSLWHLASVQARDGTEGSHHTRNRALEAADGIASALDRSWTLARLALTSAREGEPGLARETFDAAIAVASKIENGFARASALAKLAATLVEMDRARAAR